MPVRVAIIGSGWADRVQIPAFQAAGLEVVALAGRNPARTAAAARRHGVPAATTNWQELLGGDADLISIVTPPHLHLNMGLAVLEAGKHLLIEKPLALNADEADTLALASEARPTQLALIDHELRLLPARRKARELLASGAIGEVVMVTARVALDTRTDPKQAWDWWSDAERGGGVLGAIGSHVLDGILWLLGSEDATVGGATLGQTYPLRRDADGNERPVSADDIASLTLTFGRAVGTVLVHAAALDGNLDLLTFRGTTGTLVIDRSLKLYLGRGRAPLKEYRVTLPDTVPNRFRASPYAAGTVLLARAVEAALGRGEREALAEAATLHDGARVQRLLDEARRVASQRHA